MHVAVFRHPRHVQRGEWREALQKLSLLEQATAQPQLVERPFFFATYIFGTTLNRFCSSVSANPLFFEGSVGQYSILVAGSAFLAKCVVLFCYFSNLNYYLQHNHNQNHTQNIAYKAICSIEIHTKICRNLSTGLHRILRTSSKHIKHMANLRKPISKRKNRLKPVVPKGWHLFDP